MKAAKQLVVLITIFIGSYPPGIAAIETSSINATSTDIRVLVEERLVTLEARDVSLSKVLGSIGKQAGFKVMLIPGFNPPKVNIAFDRLSVEKAVARVIGDSNSIIFYTDQTDAAGQRVISQIWLLGPSYVKNGSASVTQRVISVDDIDQGNSNSRSKAVLRLSNQPQQVESAVAREPVWARLAYILESDQDALVRARAAIAIGALGDELAVYALESALFDGHSSVRIQAINALGLIGGERATIALGNVLIEGGSATIERILAAQALWRQESILARSYLEIAATDPNEQIRKAASQPQPTVNVRQGSEDTGTAATQ